MLVIKVASVIIDEKLILSTNLIYPLSHQNSVIVCSSTQWKTKKKREKNKKEGIFFCSRNG